MAMTTSKDQRRAGAKPPFPQMGRNLKAAREKASLTQAAVAYALRVSESSVQRWESGAMPSPKHWTLLENILGIDRSDLLEIAPPPGRLRLAEEVVALREEIAEVKAMVKELLDR